MFTDCRYCFYRRLYEILFICDRLIQGELIALQLKGEAEAFAVEAKAKAEAEQMEKKAEAWKEYQDAAVVDMVLEALPKASWFQFFKLKIPSVF